MSPRTSVIYEIFRQAIVEKKQVVCDYHGYRREVCPHTLGHTDRRERALTFQFAGGSSSGLPAQGQWRCLNLDEVTNAQLREGTWHTGPSHSRPQTCVKDVEIEVEF